ncbi:CD97 antigen-like isoform X1 [Amblyraja radiata]|uniref:CD97 antigen-like isoform X1 n=1 Tax=Amblyraja radiata TaxID=386614 RepID=UPI00140259E7|nr:CD97 antigen-like isoform X1 [Amblyraja radiata]
MAWRGVLLGLYICFTWDQHVTCLTCDDGYIPRDNNTCVDKDKCHEGPCGPNATCRNTIGGFICSCFRGFVPTYNQPVNNRTTSFCVDKDECRDGPCGPHEACINTFGSFQCSCLKGYHQISNQLENRTVSFCVDINECDSSPCGPMAACHNTLGSFYCSCSKGFDGDCKLANSSKLCCRDKDECQSDPCGDNAVCHNTAGSFYCKCGKGFYTAEHSFTDPQESQCKDYDECYTSPTICGSNASCYNTEGSFHCLCDNGFAQQSGKRNFTGYGGRCKDVNECLLNPCGANASCNNTVGSYTCVCNLGYISSSGGSRRNPGDVCVKFDCPSPVSTKCPAVPKEVGPVQTGGSGVESAGVTDDPFCSIMGSLQQHSVCERLQSEEDFDLEQHFQSISSFTARLMGNGSLLGNMDRGKQQEALALSLQTVESSVMAMVFTLASEEKKNMSFGNIEVDMEVLRDGNVSAAETAMLSANGNRMEVPWRAVSQGADPGRVGVALIAMSHVASVMNDSLDGEGRLLLNSDVLTAAATRGGARPLVEPLSLTFHNDKTKKPRVEVVCVALNHTRAGSHWSRQGCRLMKTNSTHTVCQCSRLTSFAVLMALYETQDPWHLRNLSLISYIGISISLVCLFISFVTFLACQAIQGTRTTIHAHLCLCLFLAELLFLVGISQTSNKVLCAVVAGFLHYFFLTVFAWMSLEGAQLYLMVVKVFNAGCLRKRHMLPVGYGLPLLIVGISAAVYRQGYGTPKHCWLSLDKHFLWSFLGPVCTIILINIVFYCITLVKLAKRMSTLKKDKTPLKKIRSFTLAAIAQLFLLGCTWIFGIFHFREETIAMAYIFTVINSFQGMFIFILHCLLNKQVREEYWTFLTGILGLKGPQYSEFPVSSSVPLCSLQQRHPSIKQKSSSSFALE